MNEIKDEINESNNLSNEISKLSNKINQLENKIDLLIKICSKMNGHIDFVEDTYNTMRNPLNFIKNKIEYYIGNSTDDLPAIEHNIES
jgi:predicted nuclease with TOPRIM domain